MKEKYLKILSNDNPTFLNKYLNLSSLKRLKDICYFCGMDYASKNIYNFEERITRYDHSLNVALITWNLTKDKISTLAALFHDISTPCFSHVIDYMNKDYETQESTEEYTEMIIEQDTKLSSLLKEDNINVKDIIDFKKYSVVDCDRPKLCADRLDGIILTGLYWIKNLNIKNTKDIINDVKLFIYENNEKEIGFMTESIAKIVYETNNLIDKYCNSEYDNYMMELLASITKRAIDINIIKYDDLFILSESELINILNNTDDLIIKENLYKFKNIKEEEIPNFKIPNMKSRTLNPLVNGKRLI